MILHDDEFDKWITDENSSEQELSSTCPLFASNLLTLSERPSILENLIGVFESRQGLAKEFKKSLAERVLSLRDYACECELRDLELMKSKLGADDIFARCEVLLGDVSDSRRLDMQIKSMRTIQRLSPVCLDISKGLPYLSRKFHSSSWFCLIFSGRIWSSSLRIHLSQ